MFRSKDYQPFLVVLRQLFQKVRATKPQASRTESAEIFVVCRGYCGPDKVDPGLLEANHVFKDVEIEGEEKINLVKLQVPYCCVFLIVCMMSYFNSLHDVIF